MRALAVTSLKPWPQLPQLPTMSQTVPGYEVMSFNGIGAPRATPRAIVMRVNREVHAVLAEPEIRRRLIEQGNEIQPTTPEEFAKKVASEVAKWQRIVAERNIDVQ
jgi:tripartite-type tricarboxylate transporter receptor subunit TctC